MARLYDSRKRALVTGGAGFLGSHLCDRLLEQGHKNVVWQRSKKQVEVVQVVLPPKRMRAGSVTRILITYS